MTNQTLPCRDLKPCPFCGSTDGFIERYDYSSCYWHCEGCCARGPLKVIEDEDEEIPGHGPAFAAWNTRAQSSAPEGGETQEAFIASARLLKAKISDDAYAASFQSMGQYRSALLRDLDGFIESCLSTSRSTDKGTDG